MLGFEKCGMGPDGSPEHSAELWKGRRAGAEPDHAGPPYLVQATDFLVTGAVFDRKAAQAALPHGLEVSDAATGLISIYSAPLGWGLAPYSACFVGIEVKDHEAPDGSPAFFMAEGWYSGRAGTIMHENYNCRLGPGEVRHWRRDDVLGAEAGPPGRPLVAAELRPTVTDAPVTSGIHHYIGIGPEADLTIYSVSFTGRFLEAESLRLDIGPGASPLLRSLRPISIPFCFHIPDLPLTFSPPRRLSDPADIVAADAARVMLLDLFSRLGRAAAIVGREGRVIHLNRAAGTLAGEGFAVTAARQLRATRPACQAALDAAIGRAFSGDRTPAPAVLARPGRVTPLLAHAMPMSGEAAGEAAVLVLFSDPEGAGSGNAEALLHLLGLTPAEARVAALVGAGHAPKEAALRLGIAESTARSSLKAVYEKLAIGRQAELAQIVARLDAT